MLLLAACVAAVVGLTHAIRHRHAVYRYDVTRDVRYDFSRSGAQEAVIRIHDGRFEIPPKKDPADTVFLAVHVRSTLLGRWLDPRVDIEADGKTLTQVLERGAAGLRYLNLSRLDMSDAAPIRLRGQRVNVDDQDATLYTLHDETAATPQTILVLSPHPDDAEIAAFGFYSGRAAYVITITAGEAGDAGLFSTFKDGDIYLEKGKERVWNSVTVPMLGGVSILRTANLGYFDGTLEDMREHPDQGVTSQTTSVKSVNTFRRAQDAELIPARPQGAATWNNLVDDLGYLVQRIKPDLIVTPYPRLDEHPDHQLTTVALVEALKRLHWTQGSLLLYTNHLPSSPNYPYGEAGSELSLPPGIDEVIFDGIVDHPLTADEQHRKYLALDAMIDTRSAPRPDTPKDSARLLVRSLTQVVQDDDQSYFRRAVRANELFFSLKVQSLSEPGVVERLEGTAASVH